MYPGVGHGTAINTYCYMPAKLPNLISALYPNPNRATMGYLTRPSISFLILLNSSWISTSSFIVVFRLYLTPLSKFPWPDRTRCTHEMICIIRSCSDRLVHLRYVIGIIWYRDLSDQSVSIFVTIVKIQMGSKLFPKITSWSCCLSKSIHSSFLWTR